jgi:hypothetical protein
VSFQPCFRAQERRGFARSDFRKRARCVRPLTVSSARRLIERSPGVSPRTRGGNNSVRNFVPKGPAIAVDPGPPRRNTPLRATITKTQPATAPRSDDRPVLARASRKLSDPRRPVRFCPMRASLGQDHRVDHVDHAVARINVRLHHRRVLHHHLARRRLRRHALAIQRRDRRALRRGR